jgi:glycosyltransferase involved in cell wall biosynthesis
MKVGLVILNKNESMALPSVLPRIPRDIFASIITIDGNSTDNSVEIIKSFGLDVLVQHSKGRGSGFAMGMKHAMDLSLDFVCFLSTDGNEAPEDLKTMANIFEETKADMIIASRMKKESYNEEDSKIIKPRKWGNNFFALIAFLLYGNSKKFITDPINGFRGITPSAWQKMKPDAEGYSIEYQLSIRAYKFNLNVVEFPTREGARLGGKSGARAFPTTLAMIKIILNELKTISFRRKF